MIKCKLNKKTDNARFKIKGNVKEIALEALVVIKEAYRLSSPLERAMFKDLILSNLREGGPVWGNQPTAAKTDEPSSENS